MADRVSTVVVNTVGNLSAVNTAEASMVNVEGMASIATELDRQCYTLARSSPAAMPESR